MPPMLWGNAILKHKCPACDLEKQKNASWFRAIRSYKCEGCGSHVVVTYDTKLKLYAEHSRQADSCLSATEAKFAQ
jgi:transposase-like protein